MSLVADMLKSTSTIFSSATPAWYIILGWDEEKKKYPVTHNIIFKSVYTRKHSDYSLIHQSLFPNLSTYFPPYLINHQSICQFIYGITSVYLLYLLVYPSIHPSISSLIHYSFQSFIHPLLLPTIIYVVDLSIHPPTHQPIYPSIHQSCSSIHPSIKLSIFPSIHLIIHPTSLSFIHPSIPPSILLSIHLMIHLPIYKTFHLSIHPSLLQSFYPSI